MTQALIGYTGFVGSNILSQHSFEDLYNSLNIEESANKDYDLIVCAGAPGAKWKANKNPSDDWKSIQRLINATKKIKVKTFILISTVDVYPTPIKVDEKTNIEETRLSPYGRHRFLLEQYVRSNFMNHIIVRLPALFGEGLKKNFIFDLINNNMLQLTHHQNTFQFYYINNLWSDINKIITARLRLVNLVTEPLRADEVVQYVFGEKFSNKTISSPIKYNVHTAYGNVFKRRSVYLYNKKEILKSLKEFILLKRKP